MISFFPSTIRQVGGEIIPPTLAGLEAWYDVTDFSTITLDGSDNITQLLDKSGNSRTMIPTTNGPLYQSTGFKGTYPSMLFDHTNTEDLKASFNVGALPLCFFGVADYSSYVSTSTNSMICYTRSGSVSSYFNVRYTNETQLEYRNTVSNFLTSGNNTPDLEVAFYGEKNETTIRKIDKMGDVSKSDVQTYGGFNTLYFGRNRDSGTIQWATSKLVEVFMFSVVPIDSDKQLMFDYFAAKYGIVIPTI